MKESRLTEEQMVAILGEAGARPVSDVAKTQGGAHHLRANTSAR